MWVKSRLQEAGLIERGKKRGAHRKRRVHSPLTGMMIHQDGSTYEWVVNQKLDLIVTMDDATNEYYSMFFVEEEALPAASEVFRRLLMNMNYSLLSIRNVAAAKGGSGVYLQL